MPGQEYIEFECLRVHQPIGVFYVGAIGHKDLIAISHSDVRRLERGEKLREVEEYIGIQRPLSPKRVAEISKYVNLVDAAFPTSVLLHVDSENAEYNAGTRKMKIKNKPDVAQVLDGQHRIAGLEEFDGGDFDFQINVTIFIGMDLEDQAIVFATINQTQTKVNKSLVSDLFEFAKTRSPQKTGHHIARALNEKTGSPFWGKIKILGTADDKEKETITQATFVDSLLRLITGDKVTDRDLYKRGKRPPKVLGSELHKFPFRNLFIDEKDSEIAQIVWNYFQAVSDKWPGSWQEVRPEMILNRSTGFVALMKFLRNVYVSFDRIGSVITVGEFKSIFDRINISEAAFNKQTYLPGAHGQAELFKELMKKSGLDNGA